MKKANAIKLQRTKMEHAQFTLKRCQKMLIGLTNPNGVDFLSHEVALCKQEIALRKNFINVLENLE